MSGRADGWSTPSPGRKATPFGTISTGKLPSGAAREPLVGYPRRVDAMNASTCPRSSRIAFETRTCAKSPRLQSL